MEWMMWLLCHEAALAFRQCEMVLCCLLTPWRRPSDGSRGVNMAAHYALDVSQWLFTEFPRSYFGAGGDPFARPGATEFLRVHR